MNKMKSVDSDDDPQDMRVNRRAVILRSLALFLPALALAFTVTATILFVSEKAESTVRRNGERHIVKVQELSIDEGVAGVTADLAILSHEAMDAPLWSADGEIVTEPFSRLARRYLQFLTHRKIYDQARLLDEQGMELLRVNFNDGHPRVVPTENLQNKQGRYYFDDAFELSRGEVFVSPMDLNVEHGEIEQPLKPMIRFATPVFDQTGKKRGVVLLNYFGAKLIERFARQVGEVSESQAMLLNTDGYWLNGPVPEDEWGFMYKDRRDRTFSARYPEAWEKIQRSDSHQFETPQGLFTFRTVYPLLEGQTFSAGASTFAPGNAQLKTGDYRWKVVSFVPSKVLYAHRNDHRKGAALILGFLALALFGAAWRIAGAIISRKQAEERFKSIAECMSDWIWEINADGVYTYCSSNVEEILGYSVEEMLDKTPFDFMALDDREQVVSAFNEISSGQRAFRNLENWILTKEGQRICFLTSGTPIFAEDGRFLGYRGVDADITERKEAEASLKQAHDFLQTVMDEFPDKFMVINRDYTIAMANRSVMEVAGEDSISAGLTCHQVSHHRETPCDDENHPCPFNKVFETRESVRLEHVHTDAQGNIRYVEIDASPLFDENGEVVQVIESMRDITERKEADAERVRLMAAIEQLEETIVITDVDANIEYVNSAFERVTGYTQEEIVGQNPQVLQSGEHAKAFYEAMWETLLRGETWSGRFINKKKNGEFYTEEATISPVCDASGQTVNYVAVKRDVTEELNLEEQLRQAQKMQSIGQLVAGIAHDFNNLMQVINGYADIARKKLPPRHAAVESVNQIAKAGDQAKDLVKQLLAFSRQQVIEPVDFDLNEMIKKSWKMLRHMIGEHIQFEFAAGDELGPIFADKGQMQQVMMNLCVNARDAMPEGGMLRIETKKVWVNPKNSKKTTCAPPGWHVRLSVSDNGFGMNKETCDHIFEPFFTTKEVGEGTGLGLSTVYGIVNQNGGCIKVSSEPEEGTTFEIYLPASNPLSEETLNSIFEGAASVEGGIETILVAEDDETILKLATQILREAGYTILSANDGEEAVRVFEEHADEIDCVMMDVVMPRLGGKDAMEKLFALRPSLRHLFVSGYSPDAGHADFIKEKGRHLLAKPYQPDTLLRKIRDVLDEDG